jgi:hypothetical protein
MAEQDGTELKYPAGPFPSPLLAFLYLPEFPLLFLYLGGAANCARSFVIIGPAQVCFYCDSLECLRPLFYQGTLWILMAKDLAMQLLINLDLNLRGSGYRT